jgi:hypothetical protein
MSRNVTSDREERKCCDVPRSDNGEVASVERPKLGNPEPLRNRNNGGIDASQREILVRLNQFRLQSRSAIVI